MARPATILLTCEHASHHVPAVYRHLFTDAEEVLLSHRGWDPGALRLAKQLAELIPAPLLTTNFSRLLVEPNRSPHHPQLFSEFTRACNPATKRTIRETFYEGYRNGVESWLRERIAQGESVLHFSIHTFTPELNGQIRNAEIGLLYDPQRAREQQLCRSWRQAILDLDQMTATRPFKSRPRASGQSKNQPLAEGVSGIGDLAGNTPRLRVRMNYPYRGNADGFTTFLRRRFPPGKYCGIELEVSQKYENDGSQWRRLGHLLADSLASSLGCLGKQF